MASHKLIQAIKCEQPKTVEKMEAPKVNENCISSGDATSPAKPAPPIIMTLPLFPDTQKLTTISSTDETETLSTPPPPVTRKRLFEEFFIIGAPASAVDAVTINGMTYLPPSILFQYPNLPEYSTWYLFFPEAG